MASARKLAHPYDRSWHTRACRRWPLATLWMAVNRPRAVVAGVVGSTEESYVTVVRLPLGFAAADIAICHFVIREAWLLSVATPIFINPSQSDACVRIDYTFRRIVRVVGGTSNRSVCSICVFKFLA